MISPVDEASLRRYAGLVGAVIPNVHCMGICRPDGLLIQDHTMQGAVDLQAALKCVATEHPHWNNVQKIQILSLKGTDQSFVSVGICNEQSELVALLVLLNSGGSQKTSMTPMLMPIAECIGQEVALNIELDAMTTELTERYEELNLVYHTEDQVNYFRESHEALRSLTQNCLDYLDVGMAALILKEKGVATVCHHPVMPIPNGQAVTAQLSGKLYEAVCRNSEIIVINDMSDDLAVKLVPGVPYRILCSPIADTTGEVVGILATVNHYSKTKFSNSDKNLLQVMARKASKIVHANYDSLTGLANRNGYEHYLESAFSQVKEYDSEKSLLHINIDQIHIINDTVSFAAGDAIIRNVSGVISEEKRDGDKLSRLGGDEFGLILDNCSFSDAGELAERICRSVEESSTEFEGAEFKITVSIGVALLSSASESGAQVMGVAEVACSVAKDQGRNRVESYRADNVDMVQREAQMHLVAQIQHSLANDNFVLYCQPIEPLSPENLSHHTEVLLRTIGKDGEIIAPGNFIPAAERYHLMPSIDRWVVGNTLSMLAGVDKNILATGTFAINLSGQSLNETSFLDFVHEELAKSGLPPECVCFEITETAAVASLSRAMVFINSLKKLGCSFSLDDFGAGLSSFGYLKSLPVDYLKIDGAIVKDIETDATSSAMVAAINQVGHAMNLKTIAEFVENDAIKVILNDIGVDYVQGYGVGKPAPLIERLQALAERPAAKAS